MTKKILVKKIDVVIFIFFLVGVSSYIFKSHIGSLFWSIKYKNESPVEWNDIKIKLPKGIVYRVENGAIHFFSWGQPDEHLFLRKKNLSSIRKDYIVDFFKNKGFQIIKSEETNFKGYESFEISYIDNNDRTYNEFLYIFLSNVIIHYEGKQDKDVKFTRLLENIKFKQEEDIFGKRPGN